MNGGYGFHEFYKTTPPRSICAYDLQHRCFLRLGRRTLSTTRVPPRVEQTACSDLVASIGCVAGRFIRVDLGEQRDGKRQPLLFHCTLVQSRVHVLCMCSTTTVLDS